MAIRNLEEENKSETKRGAYSALMWTFAVASWAIGEAAVIFLQIHLHSKPTSLWFWYLPFAISAPFQIAVDVHRRLKKILVENSQGVVIATLSYNIALLTVVANITITICATSLMAGPF